LALKPSPQKHRLEKIKYTFDLNLCDNLFDILLENNFIKLFDHKVSQSPLELEDKKYYKWHNSFNHNSSDCNIFRQFIQSTIDTGRLRFAQTREDDQLATIGFNGKGSLNWLASTDLSKNSDLIAKEEDSKLLSVEKDIVHNLQDQVIFEDAEPIKIPEFTGGQEDFSSSRQEHVTLPVLE
jgi:vacuolar-type H+-ATPase subunit C/Vma6